MYTYACDAATRTLLGIQGGPSASERDFKSLLDSIDEWSAFPPSRAFRSRILIIDPGQPTLPPAWRKRLVDLKEAEGPSRIAIVTSSPPQIGTMTAISWIRQWRSDRLVVQHPTFEEAVAWTEREACRPLTIYHELYAKARQALHAALFSA